MDDYPEISHNRILLLVFFSLLILFLSGCKRETVFVLSDPHVELLSKGSWPPASRSFALRAYLKGFRVHSTVVENDVDIISLLSELESQADIVVLSPFNAMNIGVLPENGPRFVIAGGKAQNLDEQIIESVSLDRRKAMKEAGILCANIAVSGQGRAYGLFDTDTEEKKIEKKEFFSGFVEAAGDDGILIMEDLAESGMEGLPPGFNSHSAEDDIIVLFAGPVNILAMAESNEDYGLVITEYIETSGAWGERLVLSLEDDPAEMTKALLKKMKSPESMVVSGYPARIFKGKAFRRR